MKEAGLILALAVLSFAGCQSHQEALKSQDSSTEKEEIKTPPKETKINIQTLEKWPDEVVGCACYYSKNQEAFGRDEFVYVGDFENRAFMMLDGRLKQFKLKSSDVSTSPSSPTEVWVNDDFELVTATMRIGQVDETWQHQGTLTLTSKAGRVVEQGIDGECGC